MIYYFYHHDYPHVCPTPDTSDDGNDNEVSRDSLDEMNIIWGKATKVNNRRRGLWDGPTSPNLVIHAKLYAIADKYDIQELKNAALRKFKKETEQYWGHNQFEQAMRVVYTTTPDHDQRMRNVVLTAFREHDELLDNKRVQDLIQELDLAFEFLLKLREPKSW
jgi:hypothetical protein